MVALFDHGVILDAAGRAFDASASTAQTVEAGRQKTMAYHILEAHNHSGDMQHLELKFDSMVSPDNNYVNILQTARASGLAKFPMPYVLSLWKPEAGHRIGACHRGCYHAAMHLRTMLRCDGYAGEQPAEHPACDAKLLDT